MKNNEMDFRNIPTEKLQKMQQELIEKTKAAGEKKHLTKKVVSLIVTKPADSQWTTTSLMSLLTGIKLPRK